MTDNTQPEALMQLADAYAEASFDQALHNRTLDDAPEIARSALAAAILRQHARIVELASQLESIGAGGVDGPLMGRAADHFPGVTKMVARWYMIDKDGMATLCTDREDAEKEAKDANMAWPHKAPHRAVQLVEVGTSAGSGKGE